MDQGRQSTRALLNRLVVDTASGSTVGPLRAIADPGLAVVSQATHICDLACYLAPPPIIDSLHVHTVEHSDPAGKLSLEFDENELVTAENRIPRITNAIWRCEGGATGHLLHGVALAGRSKS